MERLGSYTLFEKLGHGGMAVVHRAERVGEAGFKKKVAIKRILPQYRKDPSLLERFAAEARTNARLDHPNLVQVLDFGIDPEPYLVLEFLDGVSLSQLMERLLERRVVLDVGAALFIALEAANGLDHAHRKRGDDGHPLGIVHRDVSPQNILLSNEGAVKVSDFGLVKAADNVFKTATGVSIGRLSYMAPEQAQGAEIDGRADLFALGVTLWEMLTLRSLVPLDNLAEAAKRMQTGAFDPIARYRDVDPRIEAIVQHCLAVDPTTRMPSAQQLSLELGELLHELAPGYGRQQLARLLQWAFGEKGWSLPEPERPAAQPTDEERLSMAPVTPAVVAMARLEAEAEAPRSQRLSVPVTARHQALEAGPPRRSRRWLLGVALAVLSVAAFVTLGAWLALGWFGLRLAREAPPLRLHTTPVASVYAGPERLGNTPTEVSVSGEDIVLVAEGHEPAVLRSAWLTALQRERGEVAPVALVPAETPSRAVYVASRLERSVRLVSGEVVGRAPGVVVVPAGTRELEFFESDQAVGRVTLADASWQVVQAP